MNNRHIFFLFLFFTVGLGFWGCSSGGSNGASGGQAQINLAGSKQGQSVGFVDVDGDGIEDKVVGAPYALVSSRTGAVLVYKGTETGYSSTPMMVMSGEDNFGFSVVNIGDIDGDHKDDFAVGAINGSGDMAPSLSGTVTIYKGGSKGEIIRKLAGDGPLDKFGFFIAAGDLNGDGYNDVVVGAPFNTNDPSLYQQGAVYIYFGPDFQKRVALYASKTSSGLGWAAAVGDINGDGLADILISASGKVLGFYGGGNFSPSINSPDVTIASSATGFGKAIAVLGDFDGDGKKEIAIGAPNATINGSRDTGSVYIVKGGAGNRTIDLNAATADLIVRIDGSSLFDRFGSAITAAGDLDGDGKPEFVVGSPTADVTLNDLSGKVYLFKGKDIGPSTALSGASVFNGMTKNQAYGTTLAANKKGQVLIGAPRSNADTGGVALVDALSGTAVPGGSSGGSSGGGGECH